MLKYSIPFSIIGVDTVKGQKDIKNTIDCLIFAFKRSCADIIQNVKNDYLQGLILKRSLKRMAKDKIYG